MAGEIESLLKNIHPSVAEQVRLSLISTFTKMVKEVSKEKAEMEEILNDLGDGDNGTW